MSPRTIRHTALSIIVGLALFLSLLVAGGWILAVAIVLGLALVAVGYGLAVNELWYDRVAIETQCQALDAEWRALDQTRRVRTVFLAARRAMQAEAHAQQQTVRPRTPS